MAKKKLQGTAELFEAALAAEGITGELADAARSIYFQESSSGKNTKTSNAGAVGGMQILRKTFREVADKDWDINNPYDNARAGIRYLGKMYARGGNDVALAAAGYYGGPGGQDKARQGIAVRDPRNPNAPDTLQYAAQVAGRVGKPGVPAPTGSPAPTDPTELMVVMQQYEDEHASAQNELLNLSKKLNETPAPVAPAGPDPWKQFLTTLNKDKSPAPITPQALNFAGLGNPAPAAPKVAPRAPVLQAFQDWLG